MTRSKHTYSRFNLFIRSLIFSIYMMITVCLYSVLVMLSILVPLRYRFMLIRAYLRHNLWVLKKVCLIDYKVEGLHHVSKKHLGIVMSKHQSTWETFFLPLVFHDPAIIIKRELLWTPFFGWAMSVSDPIAINRSKRNSAMQQIITKGKACLEQGRWILIFPEGTRVPYGTVGHYKLGGARLAIATGYPIIPVAHNAGRYWGRRRFIKQPGTIRLVIGAPIDSHGRAPDELLATTKDWIESTVTRLMSDESD